MDGYDLEIERVLAWARENSFKRIVVQSPDGIKRHLGILVDELQRLGVETFVSGSHSWGGCDLAFADVERLGAQALVHVGHHGPVRCEPVYPTLFVPARAEADVDEIVDKAAQLLGAQARRVGVFATIQHLHKLPSILRRLREHGLTAVTSISSSKYMLEGLVIGCDNSAAEKVDADVHLVVAGGVFHGLGVALATGRRVVVADPYARALRDVEAEVRRVVGVRLMHISRAMEGRRALVVVSRKPGQYSRDAVITARRLLESRGVRLRIAVFDDVDAGAIRDLGDADFYVNMGCPRLATDDHHMFPGPVVNPGELAYVLGLRPLEEYRPSDSLAMRIGGAER